MSCMVYAACVDRPNAVVLAIFLMVPRPVGLPSVVWQSHRRLRTVEVISMKNRDPRMLGSLNYCNMLVANAMNAARA